MVETNDDAGSGAKPRIERQPRTRQALLDRGVEYDESCLMEDPDNQTTLPAHVEDVRKALLGFEASFLDRNYKADFEGEKYVFLEKRREAKQPDWDAEWCLMPAETTYKSSKSFTTQGEDARYKANKEIISECVGYAEWFRMLKSGEAGFQKLLENAIFTDPEAARLANLHVVPLGAVRTVNVRWTQTFPFDNELKPMTGSTPDLTYSFRMLRHKHNIPRGHQKDPKYEYFTTEHLAELATAQIRLLSTSIRNKLSLSFDKKNVVLSDDDLLCFPYAVVEIKKPEHSNTDVTECYCQIATAAARAISQRKRLYEAAADEGKRKPVPPFIGISACGVIVKVWLAYEDDSQPNSTVIRMKCIYSTSISVTWGVFSLRSIVERMNYWAEESLQRQLILVLNALDMLCYRVHPRKNTSNPDGASAEAQVPRPEATSPDHITNTTAPDSRLPRQSTERQAETSQDDTGTAAPTEPGRSAGKGFFGKMFPDVSAKHQFTFTRKSPVSLWKSADAHDPRSGTSASAQGTTQEATHAVPQTVQKGKRPLHQEDNHGVTNPTIPAEPPGLTSDNPAAEEADDQQAASLPIPGIKRTSTFTKSIAALTSAFSSLDTHPTRLFQRKASHHRRLGKIQKDLVRLQESVQGEIAAVDRVKGLMHDIEALKQVLDSGGSIGKDSRRSLSSQGASQGLDGDDSVSRVASSDADHETRLDSIQEQQSHDNNDGDAESSGEEGRTLGSERSSVGADDVHEEIEFDDLVLSDNDSSSDYVFSSPTDDILPLTSNGELTPDFWKESSEEEWEREQKGSDEADSEDEPQYSDDEEEDDGGRRYF